MSGRFVRLLPADIREAIVRTGIRNSHLLAIAPAGTISLLAGNVSSGLEPVFAATYSRSVLDGDGIMREFELTDYAVDLWRRETENDSGVPPNFITASDVQAQAQIEMQAVLQRSVDNSISKTITVPEACSFDEFRTVFDLAYDRGLKGCTASRPNPVRGRVLTATSGGEASHCCDLDREAD